jgi:hypothetical protein
MSTFDIEDETLTINLVTTDEQIDRNTQGLAAEVLRAEPA